MQSVPIPFRSFALAVAALLAIAPAPAQESQAPGKTIIILDASGSMWGQIRGKPKIEIARTVVGDLLESLDPDMELGLMAYGHREKGSCEDIELLVPPQKVDREAFLETVRGIVPKGKTPLTDSVERAAEYLKYEENAANVILVSDGIENCDRDPCVLSGELAAQGIAFRAHVVAFDLTAEESESIRCLADDTGGAFLQAQDAATLESALGMAVEAASEPKAEAMPEPKLDPATVSAPASVPAGSKFDVEWDGPDNRGDYLTIVAADAEDGTWNNYAYTRDGSPVTLTAPDEPGAYEVRYMPEGSGQVLGRASVEVTPVEATLEAPAEVVAGSEIEVQWTGPNNEGDYLTIVEAGADPGSYNSYAYTAKENPATSGALSEPGEAELRYVTGQDGRTLASAPVEILEADVLVDAPDTVEAGGPVPVRWKGPANEGDYVTIVKADAAEGEYNSYAYAKGDGGGEVTITAVEEAGKNYEVRYVEGQDGATLASDPVEVRPVSASVEGPESAVAGSEVEVEWSGPTFEGCYVTIIEKEAGDETYGKYFYTGRSESPTMLRTVETPGPAEIRFITAEGKVLARDTIQLEAPTVELTEVPEKVAAGEAFRVKWDGPDHQGDYLTIVSPDAGDGEYGSYIYAKKGPNQDLTAPEEPGEYEVRYVTNQQSNVLARQKVTVVAE